MKKISDLKDQIIDYKKLKLKEAKALYQEMINTKDLNKQKELKDKLILGTLYNVFDIIDEHKDLLIDRRDIDINDVISSLTEYWIKAITSGDIINCISYKNLINGDKLSIILSQLVDNKKLPYSGKKNSLLYSYLLLKFEDNELSFNDYFEKMQEFNTENLYCYKDFQKSYIYFENIWNRLDLKNKKDFKLVLQHVLDCRYLLLHEGQFENLKEDTATYEIEPDCVNKLFNKHVKEEFLDYISTHYSKRNQEIIKYLYGLIDGLYYTYDEIADKCNVTYPVVSCLALKVQNELAKRFKDYYVVNDGRPIYSRTKW